MTYVSARVGWHERGRALSIMELTWAGGLLVLAPVGLLAERVGWQPTLVLLGVVSLATVPLLRRWLDPDAVTAGLVRDVPGSSDEVATAATAASAARPDRPTPAARPPRRSTVLFLIAFGLIFVALESTFGVVGLWLGDVRGISPGRIAGLTAIGGIGELGGSLFTVAVVDRVGKARTAGIGLLTCAVGFGLLGSAGPLWLALVGLAIGLFGTETAIVAGIPLASEIAPTRRAAFLAHAVAWSSVARAVMGGVAALVLRRGGIGLNTSISVVAALVAVGVLVALVRGDPRLRG